MNLSWIKKVYLYLVSLISLVILVIASIMLINLALKTWVFTGADYDYYYSPEVVCTENKNPDGSVVPLPKECTDDNYAQVQRDQEENRQKAQKQRDAAQALAMIIVAAPVFFYHWKLARKEA